MLGQHAERTVADNFTLIPVIPLILVTVARRVHGYQSAILMRLTSAVRLKYHEISGDHMIF